MLGFPTLPSARGRKPLAAELAIAPLGGVLACCVFFLFVTARFDEIAALPSVPTWPRAETMGMPDLRVHLGAWGYTVTTAGRDRAVIARRDGLLDLSALCSRARRELDYRPDARVVRLMPEDDITFDEVAATYDALLERRCADLAPRDGKAVRRRCLSSTSVSNAALMPPILRPAGIAGSRRAVAVRTCPTPPSSARSLS